MAEAVVSVVLETVARLLEDEATLLSGVSAQVQDLCTELRQMQSFLRDADAQQHKNESVQTLVREIRSLSYRIEDLVDTYAIRAEAKKSSPRRGIKKFVRNPLRICGRVGTLHKFANEIEDVKRNISNIILNFQKYGIINIATKDEGESSNVQEYEQRARQTYDHQVETYFVGMKKDIKNLVSLVTNCHDHDKFIISIWGMGGLGKTTIARKVYKHEDVKASFDHFAWKCITQKFNVDEVLGDLLMQLVPGKKRDGIRSMTFDDLVRELHHVQMEKKCLIVLDDMWEVIHWQAMHAAFPLDGGKSKLLVTTRIRNVAGIGYAYNLKFLSESEGWELLQRIASSGKTDFKMAPCFKEVGIKLVSKCGGLPLAISLLGGILKNRNSLASWEIVNRDISLYLNSTNEGDRSSIGSLDQVLSLSYNDLPYHLKLCFLYLGNFKEDEEIYTVDLIPLWITEGLISSKDLRSGEMLTEVAERYFNELGHRCMVQVRLLDESTTTPRLVSCSLHDVMRDFCLVKCREEEFLKVVDDSSYLTNKSGAHRLVISIENEMNVAAMVDSIDQHEARHTRSLVCRHPTRRDLKEDQMMIWPQNKVMKHFKSLRVVRFAALQFGRKFPLELQNLIHLRSLTLEKCQLDELPSSITNLPFLHTLVLNLKGEVKIPNVIWKMKRLKMLDFGFEKHYTDAGKKLRLHGLRELGIVVGLDSEVDEIADLMKLENVRILGCKVTGIDNFYVLMEYILGNGRDLRESHLEIRDCDLNSTPQGYVFLANSFKGRHLRTLDLCAKLDQFPCYEQHFLQGLNALKLSGNYMKEDPMETLGQLPHLRRLWLSYDSYVGQILICHGFPKLRKLVLRGLSNLNHWRMEEGCMLNLVDLQIWLCPSLVMLPDLRFAKLLKTLVVRGMSSEFCDRLKEGGDDYYKIQHVRSVDAIPNPV